MFACPTGMVYPGMHQQDPATFPSPYGARTRYFYFTPDGLPPNEGEVPNAPKPTHDGMPFGPTGFGGYPFSGGFNHSPFGFGGPGGYPFHGFGSFPMGGVPIGSPNAPPGPTKTPSRAPPKTSQKTPPSDGKSNPVVADPPTQTSNCHVHNACHQSQPVCQHKHATCAHHPVTGYGQPNKNPTNFDGMCEREGPSSQTRVDGLLATPNNDTITHVHSKVPVVVHVFRDNIITKFGMHPKCKDPIFIPDSKDAPLLRHSISADMTIAEVIEQLDCKKRANTHPPWNTPGNGYPEYAIGIQEMLNMGNGHFVPGSKIMLTHGKAQSTVKDVWPELCGESDGSATKWLIRWPC